MGGVLNSDVYRSYNIFYPRIKMYPVIHIFPKYFDFDVASILSPFMKMDGDYISSNDGLLSLFFHGYFYLGTRDKDNIYANKC